MLLPMPTGQWTGSNVMVGFVVAQFCIVLQKVLSWEEGRRIQSGFRILCFL